MLSLAKAQLQSLVEELRSHKPRSVWPKKKKERNNRRLYWRLYRKNSWGKSYDIRDFFKMLRLPWASLVAQMIKNPSAMQRESLRST